MAAQTSPQIVVYEYGDAPFTPQPHCHSTDTTTTTTAFSPFGQKILLALAATGTSFVRCDVPVVLPRPQLEALDITYRRIPVAAIGKDVFCDSGLIIDALVELEYTEGSSRDQGLALSKSDKAYEAWGRSVFNDSLPLVPPQALSPEFVKDRETIFRACFDVFSSSDPSSRHTHSLSLSLTDGPLTRSHLPPSGPQRPAPQCPRRLPLRHGDG